LIPCDALSGSNLGQAVHTGTSEGAVMPCGWEGNRRSDVDWPMAFTFTLSFPQDKWRRKIQEEINEHRFIWKYGQQYAEKLDNCHCHHFLQLSV